MENSAARGTANDTLRFQPSAATTCFGMNDGGLIEDLMHNLPAYQRAASEEAPAIDRIAAGLVKQDKEARDAAAAAVQPVKHTIQIEALK
jgi:hypothetical protein